MRHVRVAPLLIVCTIVIVRLQWRSCVRTDFHWHKAKLVALEEQFADRAPEDLLGQVEELVVAQCELAVQARDVRRDAADNRAYDAADNSAYTMRAWVERTHSLSFSLSLSLSHTQTHACTHTHTHTHTVWRLDMLPISSGSTVIWLSER